MIYDPVMGRQKQNKPRRERPSTTEAEASRVRGIADMLDLPTIISTGEDGVVLEVASVGFAGGGYTSDDKPAYIRLTDGSMKLLPEDLRPWARATIGDELALREAGEPSMFPCRIEFGSSDGTDYARLR